VLVNRDAIKALQAESQALEAEARELSNKADAIEDAVYDLKAVNPNAVSEEDVRTPAELIAEIEEQGRILAEALERLKNAL